MLRSATLPLVSSLALLAATGTTSAADVGGGLAIGGYVDTVLAIADGDDAINPDGDATIDFSAFFQLDVDWQIGDDVSARGEIGFDESDDGAADLEEAVIAWQVHEQVTVIAGLFENWLGWEGADAPELYRINGAYSTSGGTINEDNGDPVGLFGINTTGVGVIITPHDQVEIGLFLVDEIYGNPDARESDSISVGGYIDLSDEDLGNVQFDWMVGIDEYDGEESIIGFDLWGELTAFQEEHGLLFALDLNYTDYEEDSAFAILAMGNVTLPTEVPMSLTLMLDYIDPAMDDGVDVDGFEVAVALLTNPTGDPNFALNVEARSISRSADDSDEFGLFVEALAVIP